ncbi:acetyltransferase [Leeuwenhoekiella sp. NPDC079379]|uniref:acetyltransferase n=1 Tax=Leeuwenhoekiella sp. NPDC079379 TaxID=3364122 RepID=UPI0037C8BBA7
MIIIGAGGFAVELLQVLQDLEEQEDIFFYDDITPEVPNTLFGEFNVLKSEKQATELFATSSKRFVLGLGNPTYRELLARKLTTYGGKLVSAVSPYASIGTQNVFIGQGTCILSGVRISNNTIIGKGCLIYYNSVVTHDCKLGDWIEISPGVNILGRVEIGNHTTVGSGSTILPNIKIGRNVIIGAGSVVTKNIPDNSLVYGVPAKIKKYV